MVFPSVVENKCGDSCVQCAHPYVVGRRDLGHFFGEDCRKRSACVEVFLLWKSRRPSEGEEAEAVCAELSVAGREPALFAHAGLRGRPGAPPEGGSLSPGAIRLLLGFFCRGSGGKSQGWGRSQLLRRLGRALQGCRLTSRMACWSARSDFPLA